MRASDAEATHLARQRSKHLGSLLYLEAVLAEVLQLLVRLRHGGGVDHQRVAGVLARVGDFVYVLFVVQQHAFLLQTTGQLRRCLVVAAHHQPTTDEVAGDGTHANASGTDEVDGFDIFCFHFYDLRFANLMTSLAMMAALSGSAIFSTFSPRLRSLASSRTVSMASWMSFTGASASLT